MSEFLNQDIKMEDKKVAVVVTTENRGVFFGYVANDKKLPDEITLTQARMCVYWSKTVKGVLGLASAGPNTECRITHAVPEIRLFKITAVFPCPDEATANWEKSPWS